MTTSPGPTPAPPRSAAPSRTAPPPGGRSAARSTPRADRTALRQRLAELRGGVRVPPRPLDARAIAALAANPGCRRRALLDGAGVDKAAVAQALDAPAPFGQSQFAFMRGHAFEARAKAENGAELIRLLCERVGAARPEVSEVAVPDLTADGPAGRAARTTLALAAAVASDGWTLLDHPMLTLEVAGATVYLEPDALTVQPDGTLTVIEIKSFPILDGSADPAKVGAAARQAAVYALALEETAAGPESRVREAALLVCPRDFANLPTADTVDVRKQRAATRRQLARLTRLEEIAEVVPEGLSFAPDASPESLTEAVGSVPAAYAPECLASCELAFHCRARARADGAVEALGRPVRGELGGLTEVAEVLRAAREEPAPGDAAAEALRRAARLRAEALDEGARRLAAREVPSPSGPAEVQRPPVERESATTTGEVPCH
ncbi:hypothetical protein [Streptomyces sp. AJS327]|uniref:hypothetical protein n=1 Tax=Streptomyces sp. AJS327 TaxID=2545265 RepID=UPI00215588D1|nr:hypothetical protein [Streptomyces sp. AJS327]